MGFYLCFKSIVACDPRSWRDTDGPHAFKLSLLPSVLGLCITWIRGCKTEDFRYSLEVDLFIAAWSPRLW